MVSAVKPGDKAFKNAIKKIAIEFHLLGKKRKSNQL